MGYGGELYLLMWCVGVGTSLDMNNIVSEENRRYNEANI